MLIILFNDHFRKVETLQSRLCGQTTANTCKLYHLQASWGFSYHPSYKNSPLLPPTPLSLYTCFFVKTGKKIWEDDSLLILCTYAQFGEDYASLGSQRSSAIRLSIKLSGSSEKNYVILYFIAPSVNTKMINIWSISHIKQISKLENAETQSCVLSLNPGFKLPDKAHKMTIQNSSGLPMKNDHWQKFENFLLIYKEEFCNWQNKNCFLNHSVPHPING